MFYCNNAALTIVAHDIISAIDDDIHITCSGRSRISRWGGGGGAGILTPNLWLIRPELYHKTIMASESEGC